MTKLHKKEKIISETERKRYSHMLLIRMKNGTHVEVNVAIQYPAMLHMYISFSSEFLLLKFSLAKACFKKVCIRLFTVELFVTAKYTNVDQKGYG